MDPKNEKALVRAINKISEQGLVREFLQKRLKTSKKSLNRLSDEELTKLLLKQKEGVPASIFKTKLNPLEAITRYLKQKNKKITEIAKLLNKKPSAISRAYKNSKNKKFTIKKTKFYIPLSEFGTPKLSILETVVKYFRDKNLKFTEIAQILDRNPKTIWTIQQRAKKKLKPAKTKKTSLELLKESIKSISKEEVIQYALKKREGIPASIFKTKLNPLEAITRYLKQKNKKITEIAKLLNKKPSAISRAYKNSKNKKFTIKKTKFYIPLSEFGTPKLSILETVVKYFRDKNLKFTEIAQILDRNPKTIWTIQQRAKKKLRGAKNNE